MNLRQERLLSRRSQLGRERFKCWNAWCSWHRQRHERGRYRCVALSLFTDPAVHHVRVQAMRQGHTTDAGPRLGTQGKYLCLELLAVFTPAWAVLIQRLFHRLHDPPSWGRCPLHAGSSRWDRRALTQDLNAKCEQGVGAPSLRPFAGCRCFAPASELGTAERWLPRWLALPSPRSAACCDPCRPWPH